MNPIISQKTLQDLSSLTGTTNELGREQQGFIGDVVDAGQKGAYDGLAGIAETFGASETRDWALDKSKQQTNTMSDAGREAMQQQFFDEDEAGSISAGEALTNPRAISMQIAHMMGMNADILAGGYAVKGGRVVVTKLAQQIRAKLGKKVTDPKVLDEAVQVGTKAYIDKVQGAKNLAGKVFDFGTATHAVAGGLQAIDVREEVQAMDFEELKHSPVYADLVRNLVRDNPSAKATEILNAARSRLADEAANRVKMNPALLASNYLVGGLGGAALDSMLRGVLPKAAGLISEGVTEGIQGGTEQFAANQSIQETAQPDRELGDGVLVSGLNEAAAGVGSSATFAAGRKGYEMVTGTKPAEFTDNENQQDSNAANQQSSNTAKQQEAASNQERGAGIDLAGSAWNEYFDSRYKGEVNSVDQETGELTKSDKRPAYLMSDQGTPFANLGQAKQYAAERGLEDYTPVKQGKGVVLQRPEPVLPDVPLSTVADSTKMVRWLDAEVNRRKESGEFLNTKNINQVYKAIASGAKGDELQASLDAVLLDPQKAAITKWNKEKNPQATQQNNQQSNEKPAPDASKAIWDAYFDAENKERRKENFEAVEAQKTPANTDADYKKAQLQREAQKLRPAAREAAKKIFKRPTINDIAKQVKRKRKAIKKKLFERGIDPNVTQKLNAVIATYVKPIKEAAGYEPNNVFADVLSNVPSVKKAIEKAPEPAKEAEKVNKALMEMYMEAEQEWFSEQDQSDEQDNFDVFTPSSRKLSDLEFDAQANQAATSPLNDLSDPSDKQKEAGNYSKGHVKVSGFDIAIENPKGSKRTGTAPDGKRWESTMKNHYGDLKGTVGADGDAIDVFIGKPTDTPEVYVVNQVDPQTGEFDEHKVMLGFDSQESATKAYMDNYEKDWQGLGDIVPMPLSEFKTWIKQGDTTKRLDSKAAKQQGSEAAKQQNNNEGDARLDILQNINSGTELELFKKTREKAVIKNNEIQSNEDSSSNAPLDDDNANDEAGAGRQGGQQNIEGGNSSSDGRTGSAETSRPDTGGTDSTERYDGQTQSSENYNGNVPAANDNGVLRTEEYSEKAIIIKGETRPHKDRIKAISKGALWNKKAGGWVFSKRHTAAVNALVAEINTENKPADNEKASTIAGWIKDTPRHALSSLEELGIDIPKALERFYGKSFYGGTDQTPFWLREFKMGNEWGKGIQIQQRPFTIIHAEHFEKEAVAIARDIEPDEISHDRSLLYIYNSRLSGKIDNATLQGMLTSRMETELDRMWPDGHDGAIKASEAFLAKEWKKRDAENELKGKVDTFVVTHAVLGGEVKVPKGSVLVNAGSLLSIGIDITDEMIAKRVVVDVQDITDPDDVYGRTLDSVSLSGLVNKKGSKVPKVGYKNVEIISKKDTFKGLMPATEYTVKRYTKASSQKVPEGYDKPLVSIDDPSVKLGMPESEFSSLINTVNYDAINFLRDISRDPDELVKYLARNGVAYPMLENIARRNGHKSVSSQISTWDSNADSPERKLTDKEAMEIEAVRRILHINKFGESPTPTSETKSEYVLPPEVSAKDLEERKAERDIRARIKNISGDKGSVTLKIKVAQKEINKADLPNDVKGQLRKDLDSAVGKRIRGDDSKTQQGKQSTSKFADKKQQAALELKALIKRQKGTLNSGFNPEVMLAIAKIGGYTIAEGVVKFSHWVRDILNFTRANDIPDSDVIPYLKESYGAIAYNPEKYNVSDEQADAMDSGRVVGQFDLDSLSDAIIDNDKAQDGGDTDANTRTNDSAKSGSKKQTLQEDEQDGVAGRSEGDTKSDSELTKESDVDGARSDNSSKRSGKGNTTELEGEKFFLEDESNVGEKPPKQRTLENIAAIRTMKALVREGRAATSEEKAIMANYVGWGGLKSVFNADKPYTQAAIAELKSLLTETEFNEIRRSVATAFYTEESIVKAMWKGVEAFNIFDRTVNVLEPTIGSGNFLGWQPKALRDKSRWSASELDTVTGNIARLIYDEANVQVKGFQDTKFKPGVFGLSIGNPPFGQMPIHDKSNPDISGMSVHNYIIAKTAKLLHANGLMMKVITSRFLDTENKNHKQLSDVMDFVGAIRLPNDAFKKNAGTEVVTDIVVFRKLKEGETSTNTIWTDTKGSVNGVKVNKYFEQNPQNILGEISNQGTMYGDRSQDEMTVHSTSEHANLGDSIASRLQDMARNVNLTLDNEQKDAQAAEVMLTESDLHIGGMMLDERGRVLTREDDTELGATIVEVTPESIWSATGAVLEKARGMVSQGRDAFDEFAKAELLNDKGVLKSAYSSKGFQALKAYMDSEMSLEEMNTTLDDSLSRAQLGENRFDKLKAILSIRNTALALVRAERLDLATIDELRKTLNTQYDNFAKTFGTRSKPATIEANLDLLKFDYGIETGLDRLVNGKAIKQDLFSLRMNYPYKPPQAASSIDDAVTYSVQEHGTVNVEYIAELMGVSKLKANAELTKGARPYLLQDPVTGENVFVDEYLSGNVKEKLVQAQNAGLSKNVALLKQVLPEDKPADKVAPSLRGVWIDPEVFEHFLLDMGYKAKVKITRSLGKISLDSFRKETETELSGQFKNDYKQIHEIFEAAAAGKALPVFYKDADGNSRKDEDGTKLVNVMLNKMSETFKTWAQSNPEIQQQIAKNFNDRVNTHIERKFNGRLYLKTVGMNPKVNMRKTQLDGALRMIQSRNVLLDHTVGAGKTFTAITGMMERKRLGLSRKSMLAVPNHIIGQFTKDIYTLYPGAKVLAVSEKQFTAKNRKQFFARIATGDYDIVVVGHSHLRFMENDPEMYEKVVNEKLSELRTALEEAKREAKDDGKRGASVNQIENSIAALSDKLKAKKEQLKERTDAVGYTFTDLGVDYLSIDEAHEFKNLMYSTRAEQVVGMNDPKGSEKAMDLLIKARSIQSLDKGGVTFMTGTPVSNSLVELYTMMYYLGHEDLKQNQITHFDAFAGSFLNTETALEYTPTGTIKERKVLKGLSSAGELSVKYRQFADVVTHDDMIRIFKEDVAASNKKNKTNISTKFPVPNVVGGGRKLESAPATPAQRLYNDYLIARMEAINGITGRAARAEYASIDNPLWVLNDARKASLDVRLVDPSLPRDPTGKVARASQNIADLYHQWDAEKGTQLVFSDMGMPAKTAIRNTKKELVTLAKVLMSEGAAKQYVNDRLARYEGDEPHTKTLIDITNDIALDETLDADVIEKAEADIADLNGMALVADTGFSIYDDLRASLIEKGVPENQIAFIHDYNTDKKKVALLEKFNAGEIRILIGSTKKMGAGTNAQERVVGLHHMDAPWRPADMEQREGRVIRQGNKLYEADPDNFEVVIKAYSTQGSSDPVMWQILERKSSAIEQFRRGELDEYMEGGSSDADSYAEFKAATTGNAIYKLKLQSDNRLTVANAEYIAMASTISGAKRTVDAYPDRKATAERMIKALDGVAVDRFDVDAVTSFFNTANDEYATLMDVYKRDDDAYQKLDDEARKDTKTPIRPKKPVLHELNNDFSQALKKEIVDVMNKAIKEKRDSEIAVMSLGDGVVIEVRLTKYVAETGDNKGDVSFKFDIDYSVNRLEVGGFVYRGLKTFTGSTDLIMKLHPKVVDNIINRKLKDAKDDLKRHEKDIVAAKRTLEKSAIGEIETKLDQSREENEWLDAETKLADVKEDLRRAKQPNKYIDNERRRAVKRSQFYLDSLKPETFEWEGKGYKSLGVYFSHPVIFSVSVYPAIAPNGDYVHVFVYENTLVPEAAEREVKDVVLPPKGAPKPDYQFLIDAYTEHQAKKKEAEKAKQQEGGESLKSAGTRKRLGKSVTHGQAKKAYDEFIGVMPGLAVDSEKLTIMEYPLHPITGKPNPQNTDQAAYNVSTGELQLYTGNIKNVFGLHKALFHELMVHRGLGLFGVENVDKIIRTFRRARKTDRRFNEYVRKVELDYKGLPEHILVEEVLARLSERHASDHLYRAWYQFKQFALKLLKQIPGLKKYIEGRTTIEKAENLLMEMAAAFKQGAKVKTSDRRDPMTYNPDDELGGSPGDDGFMSSRSAVGNNNTKAALKQLGLNDPREFNYQQDLAESLRASKSTFDKKRVRDIDERLSLAYEHFKDELTANSKVKAHGGANVKRPRWESDGVIKDVGDYYMVSMPGLNEMSRLSKVPNDGLYIEETKEDGAEWKYAGEHDSVAEYAQNIDERIEYGDQESGKSSGEGSRNYKFYSQAAKGSGVKEPIKAYHGTGSRFTDFDRGMLGSFTGAKSASKGFFFTSSKGLAQSFQSEAQRLTADLEATEKAIRALSDSEIEKLYKETSLEDHSPFEGEGVDQSVSNIMLELEEDLNQNSTEDRSGIDKIVKKYIGKDTLEQGETKEVELTLSNPLTVDFANQDYTENAINNAIEKAKKAGNDGVVFKNMDDAAVRDEKGNGGIISDVYYVFDSEQINASVRDNAANKITESTPGENYLFSRKESTRTFGHIMQERDRLAKERAENGEGEQVDRSRREFLKSTAFFAALGVVAVGSRPAMNAYNKVQDAGLQHGQASPITREMTDAKLDTATIDAINKTGDLKQALSAALKTAPKPLKPVLFKLVGLVKKGAIDIEVNSTAKTNAHGATRLDNKVKIRLYTKGDSEGDDFGTLIHEALHAVVAQRYRTLSSGSTDKNYDLVALDKPENLGAIKQLETLWYEYKTLISRKSVAYQQAIKTKTFIREALRSPDEFFVRALSDADFQTHLAAMEYEGKSLLARFKDWVKRSLFGRSGTVPSWLDAALIAAGELTDGMNKDKADDKFRNAVRELYSSNDDASGMSDEILTRIKDAVENNGDKSKWQSAKDVVSNLVGDSRKNWLALIPRRYLAELSEGKIPSIYAYMRRANQMDADRNHMMKVPANMVDEWRKFSGKNPKMAKQMAEAMHAATIAGIDPSKAYEALRDVTKFDSRNFMNKDDMATDEVITEEYVKRRIKEIKELAKSRPGEGSAKFYDRIEHLKMRLRQQQARDEARPGIEKMWANMSAEAQELFVKVRDSYADHSQKYQEALEERVKETVADERHRAAWLGRLRIMFETQKAEGIYFPLQRFGDYFAVVKRGDSVLEFVRFEKQGQQRAWMAERQGDLEPGEIIESGKLMQDAGDSLKQIDPEYHAKVMKTLDESGVQAGLMDEVNQLYLSMLPEMSMRKHFIHRKKVAGFDPDAMRAYSHNMFHGAYQLSKLKHSHKLEKYLRDMRKEARTAPDANKAGDIVVEMGKRHDWAMNPKSSQAATMATSFGFAWYLGVTPAAAMVNMTQTPMIALPVLGSRFGYIKSLKALLKASKEFVSGRGHVEKNLKGAELAAFREFERSGLIDKTLAHDLAGVAEGGLEYSSNKHKIMSGISYLFHHAERFNREVTAMAAYRLAKDAGSYDPVSIADSLTKDAHFDYSNAERARFMQNDTAKVLLLFRQHSLNMTYRMARDFNNMFRGVSPQVRKQARRQFAGVMGMATLFAGTAGLPLYTVLGNVLELALDDEDEPWEFETEFRLFLAEHLGEDAAKLVVHGAIDSLTGANVSSRVSLNNLWFREPDSSLEGRGVVQYYAEQLLGPIFGIALSGGTALSLMGEGQLQRGAEFAMPKAVKDGLRALRYSKEGVTNLRGDALVEETRGLDELYQLLGFTPSVVSEQYEQNRAITTVERRLLKRRSLLLNQFALARRIKDGDLSRSVERRIVEFNRKNPTIRIDAKTKLQSLKRRKAYSDKSDQGRLLDPRLQHIAHEKAFI